MDWKNRIVDHAEIPVADLHLHPGNWRKHPRAQAQALEGTLSEVGIVQSVIYNRRTGRLIDGHLRVELARKQGATALPVTVVDLDEDEERLILATLDPIGAMAKHNEDRLRELVTAIGEHHDRAIASVIDDLSRRVAKAKPDEPNADKETPLDAVAAKWSVNAGDIWTIPSAATPGKAHRILCGDSTSEADVSRLMGDERAVLFATDPPYAVEYDGKRTQGFKRNAGKDWGGKYAEKHLAAGEFFAAIAKAAAHAVDESAPWYWWHANKGMNVASILRAWDDADVLMHQEVVWTKSKPAAGRQIFLQAHEPCLFGWRRGHDPRSKKGSPNFLAMNHNTVWSFPAPNNRGLHPIMKPVELFEIPMQMHTLQGELCYEPFSGSGTQLVAAERMGRICYAMELMPHFVAVALERLSELGLEPKCAERTE